jgi:hypothetical protein
MIVLIALGLDYKTTKGFGLFRCLKSKSLKGSWEKGGLKFKVKRISKFHF